MNAFSSFLADWVRIKTQLNSLIKACCRAVVFFSLNKVACKLNKAMLLIYQ